MMSLDRLQDRYAFGLGKAAMALGEEYTLFRPTGAMGPLNPSNKRLRLKVALSGQGQGWRPAPDPAEPLWSAMMDTTYTQPGDYLCGPLGTFFIAAQPPLLPTLCVQTSRELRVTRPDGALSCGVNGYGGVQSAEMTLILDGWPASVVMGRTGGHHGGELPGEPGPPMWTIRLPPLPASVTEPLLPGDILSDSCGFSVVIGTAEPSSYGWRLSAAEAMI